MTESSQKITTVVIIGNPGSGKSTQSHLLKERLGFHYLSVGDYIRKLRETDAEVKERYDAGIPQPDDIVIKALKFELQNLDKNTKAIVWDDLLSKDQAQILDQMAEEYNLVKAVAFLLKISEEESVKRLMGRRICSKCHEPYGPEFKLEKCEKCGSDIVKRSDDTEETIKMRLLEYRLRLSEIEKYYEDKGRLFEIDASGDEEGIFSQISSHLKQL